MHIKREGKVYRASERQTISYQIRQKGDFGVGHASPRTVG